MVPRGSLRVHLSTRVLRQPGIGCPAQAASQPGDTKLNPEEPMGIGQVQGDRSKASQTEGSLGKAGGGKWGQRGGTGQ